MQVEVLVKVFDPPWMKEGGGQGTRQYTSIQAEDGYSHVGHFTILNATEYGHKRPITTGLDIRGDLEAQTKFEQADHRFQFWSEQKINFALDPRPSTRLNFPRWDKKRTNGRSKQLR
mmetsp:Transcript_23939/g.48081  ORF Transcript_23939/g.48081 Transcript_23939/m.48081 type:complete len:117 (+) Transcript_23939:89-439(+)